MGNIDQIRLILGGTQGEVKTLGLLELIRAELWGKETECKLDRVLDLFELECKYDPYTRDLLGAYTSLMTELLLHFGGEDANDLVMKIEDKLATPGIVGMYEIVKHSD